MTCRVKDNSNISAAIELLCEQGFEGLSEAVSLLINQAMELSDPGKKAVQKYQKTAPELAAWMETSIPESLAIMQFPEAHRRRLRTSNIAERVNRELKRRTRSVGIFSNVESLTIDEYKQIL